jgi:alcohol dehydrogenase
MRAIGLTQYLPIDHPDALQAFDLPDPQPQAGELLIKVNACAVNPIDAKLRAPKDKVESTPRILGWDAAGEVVAVGDGVRDFAVGDAVYYAGALSVSGSNATLQCVPAALVAHSPSTLDDAQAAALPLTALTAWELLFDSMGVAPGNVRANAGKKILVINGAGGVGSILIQLAKWSGLQVVATASRPKSNIWCRQMGADAVLDWRFGLTNSCQLAGYDGFDYIVCLTDSQPYWQDMANLIKPFGAIGVITSMKGDVNMNLFKDKCARICWEFMFARADSRHESAKQGAILAEIGALVDIGVLESTLNTRLYGLTVDNLRQAHALMESGRSIGKCVIDFTEEVSG